MKKTLLTMFLVWSVFLGHSQFTPGNLVVLKASGPVDPITALAPSVSLVEYSRSGGTPVSILNFPSTGIGRVLFSKSWRNKHF